MSRQIDALIAEHVFGLKSHSSNYHYSSAISCAWLVVDKMIEKYGWFSITHYPDYKGGIDGPSYKAHWRVSGSGLSSNNKVIADTAPMAICLAALKVFGVNYE